ncbi:MAG: HEAT repeat domain-containing protein [Planctomycetota bacterium]
MHELVAQLLGSDLTVRQTAIEAAEKSTEAEVISALIQLLQDPATGEQPRHQVADVLGRNALPQAVFALQMGVTDPDEIYRGLCACGLGHIPSSESVQLLLGLLGDKVNTVRNLAERSLLLMPDAVRDSGFDLLLELLSHPVPLTRSPAARLLGLTRDPRALTPLLDLLKKDRQWLVRMWAVKGLGDLGQNEAFDALADRLRHDEKNRVRAAAAEAIGKLQNPQAEVILSAALTDEDGGVRQHVEESLAKLRRASQGHDEPEEHHEPHFEDE